MNGFEIGQRGEIGPHRFRVQACVTYGNEDGQWDEWCLEMHDGNIVWLEEEDGQTFLMHRHRLAENVPAYEAVRIGQAFPVNGQSFFVTEKCTAQVMRVMGSLPFELSCGESIRSIDGIIAGHPASLEYNDEGIELVMGEVLNLKRHSASEVV